MNFTTSEENYIKSIYHLHNETGTVNTILLPQKRIPGPSVTDMLKKLKAKKLLPV